MERAPSHGNPRPRIALWFRYGAAEHAELFPALPRLVELLAERAEVRYFGFRSRRPAPEAVARHVILHEGPFCVDRRSSRDKFVKYVLWLLCLPAIGRRCRRLGVQAVYIDENLPLAAPLALRWFGPGVAVTIADFFTQVYLGRSRIGQRIARVLESIDFAAWRRLPLIITRVRATREFLARNGIDPRRMVTIYDPCDTTVFRPIDRARARARYGYQDDEVVLVFHGILHPNKGVDRIIETLASARDRLPQVRLLIVGDGPEAGRLRSIVRERGMEDRVRMVGWLPGPAEVNEALNAGDIALAMRIGQVSDHFHVTSAVAHGMAAGRPLLAPRLGGVCEVVRDGENGVLFAPDNPREFLDRLEWLAHDAEARARLGAAARRTALELFDIQKVARRTAEVLLRLLPGPERPGEGGGDSCSS